VKTNIVIFVIMAAIVAGIVGIQWHMTTKCTDLGMKIAYGIGCIAK
jgi:hypothetical protein